MQSIQPGPYLPYGGNQQVSYVNPPVHVSPLVPGESGLRVWCLQDTEESSPNTRLIACGVHQAPPPGFTYWCSVEVQPEYGIVAHIFRKLGY